MIKTEKILTEIFIVLIAGTGSTFIFVALGEKRVPTILLWLFLIILCGVISLLTQKFMGYHKNEKH